MSDFITAVTAQLKTSLDAALVSAIADKVYPYLTLPAKLDKSVSLSVIGHLPGGLVVTGGNSNFIDYGAVILVKHDNTEATLETAETSLNEIESTIVTTLYPLKDTLFKKIIFDKPSIRPIMPNLPRYRVGTVFFRVMRG